MALGTLGLTGAIPSAQAQVAAPALSQLPPIEPIAKPALPPEIPLYPDRKTTGPAEQWNSYLGGPIVRNVTNPTLIPMLPEPSKRNGLAIVYAPGGGFQYLGMGDSEIKLLVEQGVSVFVLKYRTAQTDRDPKVFLQNLYKFLFGVAAQNQKPEAAAGAPLHAPKEAVEDGLAAVRLVRSRAAEWGIDPNKLGFMGGSAGAMTAIDVGFTADAAARPAFLVAMIGPKKVDPVPETAPPLFVAAANDDPLFPGASENIVSAWAKAKRPVEAHFYQGGGHSLAKGTTADRWFDGLLSWLRLNRWLPQQP